jgi:Ice-binding-like
MKKFENITKPVMWSTTLVLAAILAGCGGSGNGGPSPGSAAGSVQKGTVCSGASCVNLGTAGNYAILTKTGVSTVPDSVVTGNIGLSPAAGSLLTGWSETANGAPVTYSTSAQVTGNLYAANYTGGSTSVDLTTAIGDMETAYTNANLLVPAGGGLVTACPGVGILDGLTITPGVYTCTVDLSIGTNIHLSGAGVYVIRTTKGITQATDTQVLLENGALAQNVFWVPALTVTITGTAGHTTEMAGVILAKTDIVVGTNVTVDGRLLAQTDVTLDQATVTKP